MDRFVVRTLDDFWALVEAHRGELALRDLGLRHKRTPHLDTAFEALARLGLAPRWPGPAAMIDALRSETRALAWSAKDLAEKLQSSVRTAERVLASDHTPTFDSTLHWADAVDRPFYVDRAPWDAASPPTTQASDSAPGAAALGDSSVPGPSAATLPAGPDDRSVPGPEAATLPADEGDTTGHNEPLDADDATDPATHTVTSGPPSARRSPSTTEAAEPDDRSGHGPGAPVRDPSALARINVSEETCILGHDVDGQAAQDDDVDLLLAHAEGVPPIDKTGPVPPVSRASTPEAQPADGMVRKENLRSSTEPPQAGAMMMTVEWRRDGEVIFHGRIARDQVRQTLKTLAKLPGYAGAVPYVDGQRVRTKKRRPHTDDLGAQIGLHIAEALRPVIDSQRALAERQAAMEQQTKISREFTDGLKDLSAQLAAIQPPSFLALAVKSIYEEFMPKEEPK
ncbi:MAG: hypothetical protein R3B09_06555 [Nannocystaceae bacterium]